MGKRRRAIAGIQGREMIAQITVIAVKTVGKRIDFGYILKVEVRGLLRRSNMEYEREE